MGRAIGDAISGIILIGLEGELVAGLWLVEGPQEESRMGLVSGHASLCLTVPLPTASAAMETAEPRLWMQNKIQHSTIE